MNSLIFKLENHSEVSIEGGMAGQSILDIALSNDIDILSLCGGAGTCKKCLICIEEGSQYLLDIKHQRQIDDNDPYYACQMTLSSSMEGKVIVKLG